MLTKSRVAMAPVYAVLPATDITRAREFYEKTLGLEVEDAPITGYFYAFGGLGTRFMVYETAAAHGAATTAVFIVQDLEGIMSELRDRGVQFEEYDMPGLKTVNGIAQFGAMGRGAWFKDSEGNIINLAEM